MCVTARFCSVGHLSRHMVVCHVAQEAITPHRDWKTKSVIFHAYVALTSLTRIQPNLLQRCPQTRQIYVPNLKQIVLASPKIRASKVLK